MSDQNKQMMSEEAILNGKFIFISYNHSDKDIVANDVASLHQNGVRVWFDINMHASDNWVEVAKAKIQHPNCVGVLFYNSVASFLSEPCQEERKMTLEKMKNDPDFKFWFVNLGGATSKMVKEATAQALAKDELEKFLDYIPTIKDDLFKEVFVYIHPENVVNDMVKEAEIVGAIDTNSQALDILKKEGRVKDERNLIELGVYMDNQCFTPVDYEHEPCERFEVNGQQYISFDDVVYTTKPLHWVLLYTKDAHSVFLCDKVIVKSPGGQAAKDYLTKFLSVAFTKKQRELFDRPARLLSLKDIVELANGQEDEQKIPPLNEKPLGNTQHYWLEDKGLLDDWQMTAKDTIIYRKGFLITNSKGIRPVIEISTNKLEEFKKEH